MIGLVATFALEASSLPAPGTAAFAAACLAAAQKSQAMRGRDGADTEAQRTDELASAHWTERLAAEEAEPKARAADLKAAKAELDDSLAQIDGYYSGVRLVNLRQAQCQYSRRTGADG